MGVGFYLTIMTIFRVFQLCMSEQSYLTIRIILEQYLFDQSTIKDVIARSQDV